MNMARFRRNWRYESVVTFPTCESMFILAAVMAVLSIDPSLELNCSGDPCMYGICLENENSSYLCYCIDGYTGINCEINWDDCWSDPCLNGGTCNDAVAAYNCTCAEGFVGVNCEQKYSECSNHPCLNNGTCLDYDGFICQCLDGYSGDYCEIDASVCNDTICKNSGECVEGPGFSFFCRCPEGWTGRLCDEDIDECVMSPCKNGGLCINVPASYTCACLFGYTGKDCDKAVVSCQQNPCKNGAVCLLEDDRPVCYCVPDYHGPLCELRYDDCESKFVNCENGGTCIDGINSFTCACPPNYSGVVCDEYDFSTTTISGISQTIEHVTKEPNISFTSKTSSLFSSLPLTTTSIFSISPRSTIRSFTKWYPFTEITPPILEWNGTMSSVSSDIETTPFFSESTIAGRDVPHDGVTESRTYPDISSDTVPTTFSTRSETRSHDGSTTKEVIYQDEFTATSPLIVETSSEDLGVVTEHPGSTGAMMMTTGETVTQGITAITREVISDGSSFPFTGRPSSEVTEQWIRTTEHTTNTPGTIPPAFTEKTSPSISSVSPSTTEYEASTIPLFVTTDSSITSQITSKPRFANETTNTERDQEVTTESVTSSIIEDCQGKLCTISPTAPTTHSTTECDCSQRGDDCRTTPSITRAAFNGKSYARQRVDVDVTNENNATLQINVRLRTRFKNGIVLHVYFDDVRYALVYLELGSLKFQFSCGLETMLLGEIDSPIDNGYEVDIDMRFQYLINNGTDKCSAKLLVNGTTAVIGEQILSLRGNLPRHANMHLGGIPLAFSHYFPHVAIGFIGCMDLLKVNNMPRHFIHDSTETFQIEECTSFLCLSNPCQNFGACDEINGIVQCKCIAGYTGPFCERSACDDNPCYLGATCISSPGTGFICVCPLGSHGLLCEEDTLITRPSFSVIVPGFSSYVAYGVPNSIKDTMELKLRLIPRTLEQISLIAYLGQSGSRRDLSDHLSITYVRGYIMLTWDLGSGVRRIFTSAPLSVMTMTTTKNYKAHTLRVGRRGREAWLAVDGIGNVTGRAVGSMTQLDVSPILYIGGHKSRNFETLPHDLPLHTGFSGCIFDVELRIENTIFPVTSTSPATGRGIGECHRNECIRHTCKNGAMCLNHGATYSCICTKDWMGPDCSTPVDIHSSINLHSCHTAV